MGVYHYQYIDIRGKRRAGSIEAADPLDAKVKLRDQGVVITRIGSSSKGLKRENLKGEKLITFTLQLSQ